MVDLEIHRGDIFDVAAEAIVNAANKELQPGGGVCGLIYERAGHRLTAWSEGILEQGQVYPGGALLSSAYNLDNKYEWIIHAVAPDLRLLISSAEAEIMGALGSALLMSAYQSVFSIAAAMDLDTIVMPSLGTGIYAWPHEIAADCLKAALNHPWPGRAVLAVYNPDDVHHYEAILK